MLAPESVKGEVALFCVTPVILAPITALTSTSPVPVPELVIVPILFTAVVEIVIPLPVALLLLKIKLPAVFVTPPVNVSSAVPRVLVSVVATELALSAPLIVKAEVVLFSVIPVTLLPTAALIVTV